MRIPIYMLSNSNSYFHAAKPGLLYHLRWSWCRMPVTLLVKGPSTVSVCLHLPAGKSCRQMNGGFDIRMLSPSSQMNPSLPLQCAWAPPIPLPPTRRTSVQQQTEAQGTSLENHQ